MSQAGYCAKLSTFSKADINTIIKDLEAFIPGVDESQIRAWRVSIRILQIELVKLIAKNPNISEEGSVILEYTIPLESRRIDALLLINGIVVVLEFKGDPILSQAGVDQAAAYARDLRAYHNKCADIPVQCSLVLTSAHGLIGTKNGVDIIGGDSIALYCENVYRPDASTLNLERFLSFDCYLPLPSLIKAARELFESGTLTRIHRASIATEPTIAACSSIIHKMAKDKRRALILISGVPGAGKTLVGLQLAHAKYLDDLAIARNAGEKPTAAAVFLSGNGPLVEVLQYELGLAGGGGAAFVRGVHDYVKTFTREDNPIPPQHVLIYDEAQRAFDAAQVREKHRGMPIEFRDLSEPELFIRFAERVPEWCVVVGLIGSGQEIHIGEEAGVGQWRTAIEKASSPEKWDIYLPNTREVLAPFQGLPNAHYDEVLDLSVTIRFHQATQLYDFVKHVLEGEAENAKAISAELEKNGYNLRMTHVLDKAKAYLATRYNRNPDARFGMVASAKDRDLRQQGIPKGFNNPGEIGRGRYGTWYSAPRNIEGSCTRLDTVSTEFGAQGLELDACLLAWGTDFIREDGAWTNRFSAGYQQPRRIKNAMTLRMNAYRVLLTRGRDGCVVFIPPIPNKMRETYSYLRQCGFTELTDHLNR